MLYLRVEVPEQVNPTSPVGSLSPSLIGTSVGLKVEVRDLLMGVIAEWRIGTQFAVTHLVVSTFVDIEVNWSVSSWAVIAHTITPRTIL